MENKFTKGEWYAHDGQIYPIETGKTLALIPCWDKDNEEKEANAKLIAAAPDLLEALEMMVGKVHHPMSPDYHGCLTKAEDAIRKAIE